MLLKKILISERSDQNFIGIKIHRSFKTLLSLCEFIMIFILIGRRIRYAFPCSIIAQGTPLSLFFCQERKTIFHLLEFSFFFFNIRSLIFLISLQFLLQAHFFFYSNVQFFFLAFLLSQFPNYLVTIIFSFKSI